MQATLMVLGVVAVMAAIVGGGLEAFNVRVPGLAGQHGRQVTLAVFGVVLFVVALLEPWEGGVERTPPSTSPGQAVEGTWTLVHWIEEPGPVQLGFAPFDGRLTIGDDLDAVWTFGVEDVFFPDQRDASSRCEGAVDAQARLTPTRGPDEILWTDNMRSLRVDIGLAFCGRALDPAQGQVVRRFDLRVDGDLLEMRNDHGTFTWRRR